MDELFDSGIPPSADTKERSALLKPVSHLAGHASEYAIGKKDRPAADPLGMGGLPMFREELDTLLVNLCDRLAAAIGKTLPGKQLVEELLLDDTRSLRLLVAYGHVHHRLRQIVGVPGNGYVWGDLNEQAYATMASHARRMGRCWFFNSALYGKKPAAVEAAQMLLDFVGEGRPLQQPQQDELAVMMAAEGVGIEQVLTAIVETLTETDKGRECLAKIGERHASVLMPTSKLAQIQQALDQAQELLRSARRAS